MPDLNLKPADLYLEPQPERVEPHRCPECSARAYGLCWPTTERDGMYAYHYARRLAAITWEGNRGKGFL